MDEAEFDAEPEGRPAPFDPDATATFGPFVAAPTPAAPVGAAGMFSASAPTMATPVVGGVAGAGAGTMVVEEVVDDEGDEPPKKKIPTSTKFLLIAIAWVALVFVLINQFKKDAPEANLSAQLDTTDGATFDDGGTPDIIDTPSEEAADLNGDGVLEADELAQAREGSATAGRELATGGAGGGEGSGGSSGSSGGGSGGGGSDDPTAGAALPGAAPTGGATGGGSGTTTTTVAAGGGSGGSGGDGGGATTTTTTKSGGGTTTTTTTTKATTTTTSAPPAGGGGGGQTSPITLAVGAKDKKYVYPPGFTKDLVLPRGSRITFTNNETSAGTGRDHSFTISDGVWDSGILGKNKFATSPGLPAGSYTYACSTHPDTMNGTLTVT